MVYNASNGDWHYNAETLAALREAEDIRLGRISSPSYSSFDDLVKEIMAEMEEESNVGHKEDDLLQG